MTASAPNLEQLRRDRWVRIRIGISACFLAVLFTVITWRLTDLHLKRHEEYSDLAARMRQVHQPLPAHRGSIRDCDGELLAHDETVYELYADRVHLHENHVVRRKLAAIRGIPVADLAKQHTEGEIIAAYHQHVAGAIARPLGMSAEALLPMLASKKPVTVLQKDIEEDAAADWRNLCEKHHITGIYLRPSSRRAYPARERLTHVLGDTDYSNHGAWGVEDMMNSSLAGTKGERWIERDNKGREQPLHRGKVVEPKNGHDVHLTIDMNLQDMIEAVLEQQCAILQPHKAVIVLTDPKTGSVLAMASRPHYERDTKSGMLRNLAISDAYEPGSTFKLVAVAAALDLGKVRPDTGIFCHNGYYEEPALQMRLRDNESLGTIPVEEVIVHSSNIGAYKIAKLVGQEDFLAYIWRFGFGQKSGLGLKGESTGHVNFDNWSGTTLSRMAMGYEVSITPLQLAMMVGAFANDGVLMKPRLVERITSQDGELVQAVAPKAMHQICKARTAQQIKQALAKVVSDGTGKHAAIEGIPVAGKTGTTQRYDEKLKKYVDGQYITSFAGFAPVDDPKLACVVILDNPKADKKELYGGKLAAPIFAEVVSHALTHLEIKHKRAFDVRVAEIGGAGQ